MATAPSPTVGQQTQSNPYSVPTQQVGTLSTPNPLGQPVYQGPSVQYAGPSGSTYGAPVGDTTNPYYTGMPSAPGFNADYNANTMSMLPGYEAEFGANDQGIKAFTQQALQQGPSAWATQATQQQALEAQNQVEQGTQSTAANTAAAEDALAAQGGMSSGARERAQESGATNVTNMSQGIERQQNLNDLQIGMNDAQTKMQELSQLPGMEQTQVQDWQQVAGQDTSNQIAENQATNAYNQNLYNQQMQAWGSAQTAQATANSGKK